MAFLPFLKKSKNKWGHRELGKVSMEAGTGIKKKGTNKHHIKPIPDGLKPYYQEINVISHFGHYLADKGEPVQVFQQLANTINLYYQNVDAFFLSEFINTDQLVCVYARGIDGDIDVSNEQNESLIHSALALQSRALGQRKPILVNDSISTSLLNTNESLQTSEWDSLIKSAIFIPLVAGNKTLGVIHLQSKLQARFNEHDLYFLSALGNIAAAVILNLQLNKELLNAYDTTIEGWGKAVDLRDRETEGHSQRVAELSRVFAYRLGLRGDRIVNLWRGALLHDIGKLGVPDSILFKEDSLDQKEWTQMRRHPEYANDILQKVPFLQEALAIPYCHHEKWDGSGYPRRLKGEEIPLEARIFALVDVWDALLSDRPYRPAWERNQAIAYIRNNLGTHFDPVLGEEFLRLVEEGAFDQDQLLMQRPTHPESIEPDR